MIRPQADLETQFRQITAEMEMTSVTAAINLQGSGKDSGESIGGKRPSGDSNPPQDHYRREWAKLERQEQEVDHRDNLAALRLDHERAELIERAKKELAAIRKQEPREVKGETEDELTKRIVLAGKGFSIKDVSLALRVTETRVRKARLIEGKETATGEDPKGVSLKTVDAHERARELAANGMTIRQIGMLTGLATSTIHRILGRAA